MFSYLLFQEILQKYQAQIADVDDVKCMYLEGDDNSLLPVKRFVNCKIQLFFILNNFTDTIVDQKFSVPAIYGIFSESPGSP